MTQKPLIILVNEGSAAASEILAAALQDNQRAKLVGTQTFGHNTIQSFQSLPEGFGIAVTIAKWVTPNGKNIKHRGVVPDVTVPLSETQRQILVAQRDLIGTPSDPQYKKAIEVLRQMMPSR